MAGGAFPAIGSVRRWAQSLRSAAIPCWQPLEQTGISNHITQSAKIARVSHHAKWSAYATHVPCVTQFIFGNLGGIFAEWEDPPTCRRSGLPLEK